MRKLYKSYGTRAIYNNYKLIKTSFWIKKNFIIEYSILYVQKSNLTYVRLEAHTT